MHASVSMCIIHSFVMLHYVALSTFPASSTLCDTIHVTKIMSRSGIQIELTHPVFTAISVAHRIYLHYVRQWRTPPSAACAVGVRDSVRLSWSPRASVVRPHVASPGHVAELRYPSRRPGVNSTFRI